MDRPSLLVIAGCNGSGKSSFSNAITDENVTPFDFDKKFLEFYESVRESELRTHMAQNMARDFLKESIDQAILDQQSFCYETNFDSTPMYWPEHFRESAYEINMILLLLRLD